MKIRITGCSSYEYGDNILNIFVPSPSEPPEGIVWNGVLGTFISKEEAEEIARHGKVVDEKDLPLRRNSHTGKFERKIGYKDKVDVVTTFNVDADVWKEFKDKYGVAKVCCYDIGGDLVPNVTCYPSPCQDRYFEIYLDNTEKYDSKELQAMAKTLSEIVKYDVEITSHPTMSKAGRIVCRILLPKARKGDKK